MILASPLGGAKGTPAPTILHKYVQRVCRFATGDVLCEQVAQEQAALNGLVQTVMASMICAFPARH